VVTIRKAGAMDAMARIMIWRLGADLYHRRASQS
jgi:hypothetical protein